MDFKTPFFLLSLIMGLTYIIAGWVMIKFPPKWPNYFYGYRTGRAMKSEPNWNFAQRFSAKEMMKAGVVFLLIAVASPIIPSDDTTTVVTVIVLLFLLMMYPIISTERALKKFDNRNSNKNE
ncbi:SdpI family protein [Owenweeksia hongkongensis]|uniref:SdpI family protein n=1 Tax=Owenweeksia hongkongensis TaxID=253245 RepID=UPI003A91D452